MKLDAAWNCTIFIYLNKNRFSNWRSDLEVMSKEQTVDSDDSW